MFVIFKFVIDKITKGKRFIFCYFSVLPIRFQIISISTLPYETRGYNNYKIPIEVGLTVNPYLEKPIENGEYFFTNKSRMKNFELDLVLLNQNKTKYNWNNMRINKPQTNFSFDVGLAIKGKIDDKIKDKTSHKVKFLSFHHQLL